MSTTQSSDKKWYQKPENLTSAVFISVLGYIGYNFGAGLLAGILSLGGFLLLSGVMSIALGLIYYQHRTIGTVWNVLMYKLTNSIYKIDPIAIAWSKLASLKVKGENINKAVARIRAAFSKVTNQLNTNNKEIKEKTMQIQALNASNRTDKDISIKLLGNQIIRLEDWNKDLTPLQSTMDNMHVGLKKLYDASQFIIKDKENYLTTLQQRYDSVKIGWDAIKDAQGIYGTNSRDRQDIEQLIGIANDDMNIKLAEMDNFMEQAQPVFQQVDLEKSMNDINVQNLIDKLTGSELDKTIENLTSAQTINSKSAPVKKNTETAKVLTNTSNSSSGEYDV